MPTPNIIYMDYLATTPVHPDVMAAMLPYFTEHFGNPASTTHPFGWRAQAACEQARSQVAGLCGAQPEEIVFTSGATEANNLALRGVVAPGGHIITQQTEHRAVFEVCHRLATEGIDISFLQVDREGLVAVEDVAAAIRPQTSLVSVMHTNNEIGTMQPIAAIGALCHARGILFHTDAAQAATWADLDVSHLQVDLMSLSGHKMYGPKGVGALYVRRRDPRVQLCPLLAGGGHERGRRAGTLNVPGIVGMGSAAHWCGQHRHAMATRLASLRDTLRDTLVEQIADVEQVGHLVRRHPGNLNLSFAGTDAARLLGELPLVALSAASACQSGQSAPSHVLLACGLTPACAKACLRFGLGLGTTLEDVQNVARAVKMAVETVRGGSRHHVPDNDRVHRTRHD